MPKRKLRFLRMVAGAPFVATLPCQSGNFASTPSLPPSSPVATLPCQSGNRDAVGKVLATSLTLQLYHAKAETDVCHLIIFEIKCVATLPCQSGNLSGAACPASSGFVATLPCQSGNVVPPPPVGSGAWVATLPCQSGNKTRWSRLSDDTKLQLYHAKAETGA